MIRLHTGTLVRTAVGVQYACTTCRRLLTREEWAQPCPEPSQPIASAVFEGHRFVAVGSRVFFFKETA